MSTSIDDAEQFQLGRHEGWSDVAARLRAAMGPGYRKHDIDGLIARIEKLSAIEERLAQVQIVLDDVLEHAGQSISGVARKLAASIRLSSTAPVDLYAHFESGESLPIVISTNRVALAKIARVSQSLTDDYASGPEFGRDTRIEIEIVFSQKDVRKGSVIR